MIKQILESIADREFGQAKTLLEVQLLARIGERVEEHRIYLSGQLLGEESTHDWFRSLTSDQQMSYLKMHPKSELRKFYKITADGKVVTNDDSEKNAPQKLAPPKEEKKISDVKAPAGYTGKKEGPKETTAPEDVAPSKQKPAKTDGATTLDDLRAKQKISQDYDRTPAKEVKGKSAQDILASEGSPTDMQGPDAESGKEGADAEFERELIAGLKTLSDEVRSYKTRKAEAQSAGKEFTEEPPKFELCHISVPGTNLFCQNNVGVPRSDMPQLTGKAKEGSPAASLPQGKDGDVSIEKQYAEQLKKDGIKTKERKVDVSTLKATQTNLAGEKIAGMLETLKVDPQNEALNAPIYVSRDGYILDGHHRWAALLSLGIADGLDEPVAMNVIEVDKDIQDLLDYTNKFASDMGIQQKKAGETTGSDKKPVKESFRYLGEMAMQRRATCPVCFRDHAIKGISMVQHGYSYPDASRFSEYGYYGSRIGHCAGTDKPYYNSKEGLEFVKDNVNRLETYKKQLISGKAPSPRTTINRVTGEVSTNNVDTAKELAGIEYSIKFYKEKVEKWEEKEPSVIDTGAAQQTIHLKTRAYGYDTFACKSSSATSARRWSSGIGTDNPDEVTCSSCKKSVPYLKKRGFVVMAKPYKPNSSSDELEFKQVGIFTTMEEAQKTVDKINKKYASAQKKAEKLPHGDKWWAFSGVDYKEAFVDDRTNRTISESKATLGNTLPDEPSRYFEQPKNSVLIPVSKLQTIRARPDGIAHAEKYMAMAYNGEGGKRKPISLKKNDDGTYTVLDGNSTTTIAKKHGWKNIVAIIEK